MRAMVVVAALLAAACSGDKEDPAHRALRIRQDFQRHFRRVLDRHNGGLAPRPNGNKLGEIRVHARENGCSLIYSELVGTEAPTGITISCHSFVKGDQWELWSNEINVLEAR